MKTYYPERLEFRVPRGVPAALAQLAAKRSLATPEYLRRLFLDALAAEGVTLPDERPTEAEA